MSSCNARALIGDTVNWNQQLTKIKSNAGFWGEGKPRENLSVQSREQTNSTHMWSQNWESNRKVASCNLFNRLWSHGRVQPSDQIQHLKAGVPGLSLTSTLPTAIFLKISSKKSLVEEELSPAILCFAYKGEKCIKVSWKRLMPNLLFWKWNHPPPWHLNITVSSGISITCYTGTWKNGDITALFLCKFQPLRRRSFILVWRGLQFHMPWKERTDIPI